MINEFLTYQKNNKGLSPETIEGYEKDLRSWVRFASPRQLRWSTTRQEDIEQYVISERARGMKPRTIKRRVETLRLIYKWAMHRGMMESNPAQYVQTPKTGDELPKAADIEALESYLDKEPTSRTSLIIHIMTALIMETGMRLGEVMQLEGRDIDLGNQEIRVKGKGNKQRIVYYGERTKHYATILTSTQGQIFRETAMTYRFMMYNELPGVHPHAIRHAFAMAQLNKGMRLSTLSALMGHKHTSTTEIYARVTNNTMRQEYRQLN